jgi:hypothetical protein
VTLHLKRQRDRLNQSGGEGLPGNSVVAPTYQDSEFISAEAGDNIIVPHLLRDPVCHAAKQAIADLMAKRVIDLLESIEIQEEKRHRLLPVATSQRGPQLFAKPMTIGQSGEAVTAGQRENPLLLSEAWTQVPDRIECRLGTGCPPCLAMSHNLDWDCRSVRRA